MSATLGLHQSINARRTELLVIETANTRYPTIPMHQWQFPPMLTPLTCKGGPDLVPLRRCSSLEGPVSKADAVEDHGQLKTEDAIPDIISPCDSLTYFVQIPEDHI